MIITQYAASIRDVLLDAHDRAADVAERFQHADIIGAGPEAVDLLRRLVVMRAQGEAAMLMELATALDKLAESASDNETP